MDFDNDLEEHFDEISSNLEEEGDDAFETFNGKCGWVEFGCKMQEFLVNSYIFILQLAFNVGDMDTILSTESVSEVRGAWLAVGIALLLAAGSFQLISAGLRLSGRGAARAAIMTLVGVPLVFVALDVARLLEKAAGKLASQILNIGFGSTDDPSALGSVIANIGLSLPANNIAIATLGIISAALLALAFAFRAFVLLLLIVFAPVMMAGVGYEKTREYAGLWIKLVAAMILAKPLIATVIAVCGPLVISSLQSFSFANLGVALVGLIGFVIAAFMPLVAFQLVSFMGGQIAGGIDAAASSAKGTAQRLGGKATQAGSAAAGGGLSGSSATRPVAGGAGGGDGSRGGGGLGDSASRAVSANGGDPSSAGSTNDGGDSGSDGESGAPIRKRSRSRQRSSGEQSTSRPLPSPAASGGSHDDRTPSSDSASRDVTPAPNDQSVKRRSTRTGEDVSPAALRSTNSKVKINE